MYDIRILHMYRSMSQVSSQHSAAAVSLSPWLTEVAIFGGYCSGKTLADTTVLQFGESTTSSIFCRNGRRVIENRRGVLVATICPYISTLTSCVQEEELGEGSK